MALRITQAERQKINSQNASARKKISRLQKTFNITPKFKVKTPSSFSSRKEFNIYKEDLRVFLNRNKYNFIKGGLVVRGEKLFHFAIPKWRASAIKRNIRSGNKRIEQIQKIMDTTARKVGAKKTDEMTLDRFRHILNQTNLKWGSRYSSYYRQKFEPEKISSEETLKLVEYSTKNFLTSEGYEKKQAQAKENYKEALFNVFGQLAVPVINIIDKLSTEEFIAFYESDEYLDFSYIYDYNHAKELIQIIYNNLISFIDENNVDTDDLEADLILIDAYSNLSSGQILSEYNKGSLGGKRYKFKSNDIDYYVDLSPEEVEYVEQGNMNYLNEIKQRWKKSRDVKNLTRVKKPNT